VSLQAALLRDICEHPEDDAPRLVYADWLEENTDGERGEFIRLQCRLASLAENDPERPRLRESEQHFAASAQRWLAELPSWVRPLIPKHGQLLDAFHRGFLARVGCTAKQWLKGAAKLVHQLPVERLLLVRCTGLVADVARSPHLNRLQGFGIRPTGSVALGITARDIGSLTAMNAPLLTYLDIGYGGSRDESIAELVKLPLLPRLTRLSVAGNGLTDASAPLISALSGLTSLDLSANAFGSGIAAALASSKSLSGLRTLDLAGNLLGVEGASHLAGAHSLPSLEELDLGGASTPFDEGLRLLADSPLIEALRTLRLYWGRIGPEGIEALAATPRRTRLEHLDLLNDPIGDRGAMALARSPVAATLRTLNLRGTGIGPDGVTALASSPWLTNLETLWLGGYEAGEHGAIALLDSPHLGRLQRLSLGMTGLSEKIRGRLRERFQLGN
jgi:uncharacterized protein (TIGR02996 family)